MNLEEAQGKYIDALRAVCLTPFFVMIGIILLFLIYYGALFMFFLCMRKHDGHRLRYTVNVPEKSASDELFLFEKEMRKKTKRENEKAKKQGGL